VRSLWENIFRRESGKEQELHELLGRIPLFERLNRRELQYVARMLYRRRYDAGECIFRQGDIGIGMYVIERGCVEVIYEPTTQLLTELREGDFFGEVALLNETRRSATARARTDTTLLCMLEPDLQALGERSPRLGFKVLLSLARIAGRRLIEISDEYEEMRLSVERQGAPPTDRADATGERVIHEVRAGDGAGQTKPSDDRASAKTFD
jgi:CRP-like cAMP-binding protein